MSKPVYMTIPETAKYTGFAECFIRKSVKEGTAPAIMIGKKYMVNVPLWLKQLEDQSERRKN